MRVMLDTNILISSFIFKSRKIDEQKRGENVYGYSSRKNSRVLLWRK